MIDTNTPWVLHTKWLTLGLVSASAAWELFLIYRQNRALRRAPKHVPSAISESITQDQYEFANRYSLVKNNFAIVHHMFSTAISLGLVAVNGLAIAWYATCSAAQSTAVVAAARSGVLQYLPTFLEGSIGHLFAFSTTMDIVTAIIELPFDLYFTFWIEQSFGFNKQTPRLFFQDWVKCRILSCVMSVPIAALVSWVLRRFQESFPLYLFGLLTSCMLLFSVLYPTLIQPLFNKYTPLENGPLRTEIESLASSLAFPLKALYVVDGSKRSAHSNAYLYGFFKNKRIVLYDTLISQLEPKREQILAVLAHELGHWKCNHTVKQLSIGIAHLFAICYGAKGVLSYTKMYTDLGFHTAPPIIGLIIYLTVLLSPIETVLQCAVHWLTRKYEYEADRFAVQLKYGPDLKNALVRMMESNASTVIYDPLFAACKYTHPPMLLRLAEIDRAIQKQK